jgi:hypothetical protein
LSNPSGSSIERGWNCPAYLALPHAGHTGEGAIKGTDNHDKIEGGLSIGGDLSTQPEVVRTAMTDALSVDVEVSFALDVEQETVRCLGRRLGRRYGKLGPSEIALTVDAIIVKASGWEVWDWKSRKRVTAAKNNWQIRAAAVAILKHEQLSKIKGAIGYLDNGEADIHAFDVFDVPRFFEDMRQMLDRIGAAKALAATGVVPEVHSGPWCDYCPAMPYCPAHARLAMTMLGELDAVRQEIAFFTPEQVSKAWDLKKKIETILGSVDESLRLRISQSVIPRDGKKRLAMVDCKRTGFDLAAAKKKLADLGVDLKSFDKQITYQQVKEVNVKE